MEAGSTGRLYPRRGLSLGERLSGLARACHPFPTVMVVLLTGLVGFASARGGPHADRLALAVAAMLLSQLAIGWDNDYVDRERDAVHQPEKPLPSGILAASLLPPLIAACIISSSAMGLVLGPTTFAFLVLGTAAGFGYNLALKRTRWSWSAYVAGFALLPPFVWSALDVFRGQFLWLYPIGAPLVLAAHVGNALPDVDSDTASGERGLVVRLGRQGSQRLLFACVGLSPVLIAVSAAFQGYQASILAPALAAYGALVVLAARAYRSGPRPGAARVGFRFVAVAGVILTAAWLAAL